MSAPPAGFNAPSTSNYSDYYQQSQSYQGGGQQYYGQSGQQYGENAYAPAVLHIQNPFGEDGPYARGKNPVDPETEAQIAQWQSAYASKDDGWRATSARQASGANTGASTPSTYAPSHRPGAREEAAPKTVARAGGGERWTDSTLLEWDPAHFRLFVGNLAGEVTDDSLFKAFAKYSSAQKARVIRDKRTQKSRGYGFVSFSDGDDYFKAGREMQGKYIGSHPILLRRATTEVRPVSTANTKGKKGGGGGGNKGSGKVKQDGVKKPGKTKGGLKILG